MGISVEDKGYFSRFVCTDSSLCQLPISSNTIVLLFLVEEGYLFRGNLCSAFRQKRRSLRVLPASNISQLYLAQNNHYAEVVYLGVICSDLLRCFCPFIFPRIVSLPHILLGDMWDSVLGKFLHGSQSTGTSITPSVTRYWSAQVVTKNLLFSVAGCPHPLAVCDF